MAVTSLRPGVRVDARFALTTRLSSHRGIEVWRAVQHPLNREVVVKLIPRGEDPRRTTRFQREAEALGRLNHPSVVDVYDHGEWDGWLYLVTAWIPGPLLEERLGAPWDPAEAIAVVADIAAGLAYAHARDVVHRDLSPARVVLSQGEHGPRARLVDFATARSLDSVVDTTGGGVPVGTPGYMAPERIEGARGDPRGDVYAAGLILYELLAGTHPFKRGRGIETLAAQAEGVVPPLAQVAPRLDLPAAVHWVVDRATRRDPRERLPDGEALVVALVACRVAMSDRRLRDRVPRLVGDELVIPADLAELPTGARRPVRRGGVWIGVVGSVLVLLVLTVAACAGGLALMWSL